MNDPSVQFHGAYRKGEALWCESRQQIFRFVRMEGDNVVLSDHASMKELPGTVSMSDVRRYSASEDRPRLSDAERQGMAHDILRSRNRG